MTPRSDQDDELDALLGRVKNAQLDRRTLLGGAAALSILGSLDPFGFRVSQPASAQTALEAAISEARSLDGYTFNEVKPRTPSEWQGYSGAWCAWFATYIARATGVGLHTSSGELYNSLPHGQTPLPGDFIYYKGASTTGHTGFVVSVTNGVPSTVEGNTPGNPTEVSLYSSPWAPNDVVGYARPDWGSASSVTTAIGDTMAILRKKDTTGTYYVLAETYWYAVPDSSKGTYREHFCGGAEPSGISDARLSVLRNAIDAQRALLLSDIATAVNGLA
jgi:hypothetical protein